MKNLSVHIQEPKFGEKYFKILQDLEMSKISCNFLCLLCKHELIREIYMCVYIYTNNLSLDCQYIQT